MSSYGQGAFFCFSLFLLDKEQKKAAWIRETTISLHVNLAMIRDTGQCVAAVYQLPREFLLRLWNLDTLT